MTRLIIVVRVPGFHRWKDAPEDVAFLRDRHRHLFTVRVEFETDGLTTRQVEFFQGQGYVRNALHRIYGAPAHGFEFGERGCEDVAKDLLLSNLGAEAVEVWEDDENGARVER